MLKRQKAPKVNSFKGCYYAEIYIQGQKLKKNPIEHLLIINKIMKEQLNKIIKVIKVLQNQSFMWKSQYSCQKNKESMEKDYKIEDVENEIYKSRSLKKKSKFLDTSFELLIKNRHADTISDKSIDYLKSVFQNPDLILEEGFNTFQLFACDEIFMEKQSHELCKIIQKNPILNDDQINQFIADVESQQQLKKLLENLYQKFPIFVFHELVFVYYCVWQKYLEKKKDMKFSLTMKNMNLPTLLNLNQILDEDYEEEQYCQLSIAQIETEVQSIAHQISGAMYLNKNIKYINLMEAQFEKKRLNLPEKFSQFMKEIVKTLVLVSEGYFEDPNQLEQSNMSFESFLSQSQESFSNLFSIYEKPIDKKRKME